MKHTLSVLLQKKPVVLSRVKAETHTRAEVLRVIDIFRAKVVDVSPKSYAVEVTGSTSKIQVAIDILRPIGMRRSSEPASSPSAVRV